MQNVSKIEAFQMSTDSSEDEKPLKQVRKQVGKVKPVEVEEEEEEDHESRTEEAISDTGSEVVENLTLNQPSDPIVFSPGFAVPPLKKYGDSVNAPLKSMLIDDVLNDDASADIKEEPIVPKNTLGITTSKGIPFPAKNDVMDNDEQRVYWIANILYELMPDNGLARFTNEVRDLSNRYKDDTFGDIIKHLKTYANDKQREESQKNTMHELVTLTKELQQKVQQLPSHAVMALNPNNRIKDVPAPMMQTGLNPMATPSLLPNPGDSVEMFTPMPSTYQRTYSNI
jgi:hypothetical protein